MECYLQGCVLITVYMLIFMYCTSVYDQVCVRVRPCEYYVCLERHYRWALSRNVLLLFYNVPQNA